MCFSPEVSFATAVVLVPAGVMAARQAYRVNRQYVAISILPALLGLQQLSEGLVWTAGAANDHAWVQAASLAYMFFSWIAWPVWIPLSVYFLEPEPRRNALLVFLVAGSMLGALQYVPYFVHEDWLRTQFLPYAVAYSDIELLDGLMRRSTTYAIYLAIIITPLLLATDRNVKIFGLLVTLVVVVTFLFFRFAYISVFCFGGALVSAWLVYVAFRALPPGRVPARAAGEPLGSA